ncbi:LytR/AlgR family response regulator transcription factor [Spirosoma arcticum]
MERINMDSIQLVGYSDPVIIDSIVWLQGDANYTRIHHKDSSVLVVAQPLFWFEQHLNFIRVHRSAIINPMYVQEFLYKKGRSGSIRLVDDVIIPVSRARLEHTAAQLNLTGMHNLPFIENQNNELKLIFGT